IDLVNREYVPVRVDNDVRPDINQRYNMGGWPTTAFLTPQGDILTGATYLPPDQMADALAKVASYYRMNKPEIVAKVLDGRRDARSGPGRPRPRQRRDRVRPRARRLRLGAQVPADRRHLAARRAGDPQGRARPRGDGPAHAGADGRRRHVRPRGGRVLPLLD